MAMFNKKAIERRLGMQDSRGPQGIMSRGANVYNGGTPQAQSGGGPQFGRPSNQSGQAPQAGGEDAGALSPSLTTLLGSLPPQAAGPPSMAAAGGAPLPPGIASQAGIPGGLPGGLPPTGAPVPPGAGLGQQGGSDPTQMAAIMAILQKRYGGGAGGGY